MTKCDGVVEYCHQDICVTAKQACLFITTSVELGEGNFVQKIEMTSEMTISFESKCVKRVVNTPP